MKRAILIFITCLFFSVTAFADVKIKIRQTMSGQSFENTTYIKGKRERTEQNTGGMQIINITQCDLRRSLQIMPASKVYTIDAWQQSPSERPTTQTTVSQVKSERGGVVVMTTTIKDTGERKQMFGYTARHLIITMETVPSPDACQKDKTKMQTDGWYIDATFALECQNDKYQNYTPQITASGGCRDRYEMKQIGTGKRGYPVYEKMTMFDETGKETYSFVNEVIEISNATLEASLFDIPEGYRQVKDSTEMYETASMNSSSSSMSMSSNSNYSQSSSNSALSQNVQNLSKSNRNSETAVGAKKEGSIRIGLAQVKTGAIGEGLNAADLAAAIQNTLGDYLKGTKVELVALEAKLPSALAEEAKEKQCDFVLYANVSHKKGGGGFGGFGKVLGGVIAQTGGGAWGNTAANVAGAVIAKTIVAATVSQNVKSKDEITLDIKLQKAADNSAALAKQYKAKAKSDGQDIISPMIEQAAQEILNAVNN